MSVTSALERIRRWAEQNDPEFVALLQPGLTRQEINAAVGGLPFTLAEEVYELYQWRNGQQEGRFRLGMLGSPFDPYMPLEEAIKEYTFAQAESYQIELEGEHFEFAEAGGWLPILGMERYYKATLGTTAGTQSSYILGITREGSPYIAYDSLATMLEYYADVYEAGALRTEEQGGDFFDYTITSAIKRSYFPDKVVQAEEVYRQKYDLSANRISGTSEHPTGDEFAQYDLVRHLASAGSLQAEAATERYLEWLLGDVERAKQTTHTLLHSPYRIMYGGGEPSILVRNLVYSFL